MISFLPVINFHSNHGNFKNFSRPTTVLWAPLWFCHNNHFLFSTSLPVSFHWCVSRQCNLPPGDICSPTMEHKNSCSLIVNHVFHDSGKYCVNVGVVNDVSGTNTSLMVQIPGKLYIYTNVDMGLITAWAPYTCGWVVNFVHSCLDPPAAPYSSFLKHSGLFNTMKLSPVLTHWLLERFAKNAFFWHFGAF